jgi:hypothetical protein
MTTSRVVRNIMHVARRNENEPRCEPDSHAVTTVAGSNMRLIEATGEVVNIAAHSDEIDQPKGIPIATAGTVYDFGLQVQDTPKRYDPTSLHGIHVPKDSIDILMSSDGVISYFGFQLTKKPTRCPGLR